jgi:hypothetical protein
VLFCCMLGLDLLIVFFRVFFKLQLRYKEYFCGVQAPRVAAEAHLRVEVAPQVVADLIVRAVATADDRSPHAHHLDALFTRSERQKRDK